MSFTVVVRMTASVSALSWCTSKDTKENDEMAFG